MSKYSTFLSLSRRIRRAYEKWDIDVGLDNLEGTFDEPSDRVYDHAEIVNFYYNLCHELMEYGWGDSLHFAPMVTGETLEDAVKRHQRMMIEKLGLSESMYVIDVGCGVGGPMRRVATETGAKVCCINNNEYQLDKARSKNVEAGLDHLAEYVKCDFMDMRQLEENTFDAGYAIESTCHADDKRAAFAEIYRVLKPGARLWGQEMCLTDSFDPTNAYHEQLKNELKLGIALKDIETFSSVNNSLEAVGFELLEAVDFAGKGDPNTKWYSPMESRHGTVGNFFRRTPMGRKAMESVMRLSAFIGLLPRQSHKVMNFVDRTANAYVSGGKEGVFTPLYCFLARKPD